MKPVQNAGERQKVLSLNPKKISQHRNTGLSNKRREIIEETKRKRPNINLVERGGDGNR